MTQASGQPANVCEKNLLRAINELGKDAKLLPIKTKLNRWRETSSCPYATLAQVDTACTRAMNAGHVRKTGVIYALTEVGENYLAELESELVTA